MKALEGLTKLESSSMDSYASIDLTFQIGTDRDTALLKVSNALEQVPRYPSDADKPIIYGVSQEASAIAWFVLQPGGEKPFAGDISTLRDFVNDFIKPEFERVPGLATANVYGGQRREMHVIFAMETASGSTSTARTFRRVISPSQGTTPLPQKGSSTVSPGPE